MNDNEAFNRLNRRRRHRVGRAGACHENGGCSVTKEALGIEYPPTNKGNMVILEGFMVTLEGFMVTLEGFMVILEGSTGINGDFYRDTRMNGGLMLYNVIRSEYVCLIVFFCDE